jgi:hypothetical protein
MVSSLLVAAANRVRQRVCGATPDELSRPGLRKGRAVYVPALLGEFLRGPLGMPVGRGFRDHLRPGNVVNAT